MQPRESEHEAAVAVKAARLATGRQARLGRLLDAKQRALGVCTDSLDAQVAESAAAAEREREDARIHGEYIKSLTAQLNAAAAKDHADRRRARAELQQVWKLQTKARPFRAEYDLSDPQRLSKDALPMEETSGPSSAQFIAGLPDTPEVKLAKQIEQRRLLADIVSDKERTQEMERALEQEFAVQWENHHKQRCAADRAEQEFRAQWNAEVTSTNGELSSQRQLREAQEQELAEAEAERERAHIQRSSVLSECRTKEVGFNGRPVRQEWKGMTPVQLEAIRQEQRRQMEERARVRAAELQYRNNEDANYERARQLVVATAANAERERRQRAANVLNFHRAQKSAFDDARHEERQEESAVQPVWWPFGRTDR
mmetsp:Transcript_17234/g.43716  ORF Transcript_17234/g.43716 Transcript_17234/m.43716 type:complete len:371 (-) Transcript_17234:82-1194(-)